MPSGPVPSPSDPADAAAALFPWVYDELRAIAGAYLNGERAGHTLQPTALVHEVYLKLVAQTKARYKDAAHFKAVAAEAIRRVLVDHARTKNRLKRGGDGGQPRPASPAGAAEQVPSAGLDTGEILAIHEALERFATIDPRAARVVEMKHFGDLTNEEAAQVLGVSVRTVKNDWTCARQWLEDELRKGG